MPNFKPKKMKKIKKKGKIKITLDKKHKEKMLEFQNIKENLIPLFDNELEDLKKKFKNSNNIEEKLLIKEKIKIKKKKKKKKKRKTKRKTIFIKEF